LRSAAAAGAAAASSAIELCARSIEILSFFVPREVCAARLTADVRDLRHELFSEDLIF